MALVNWQIEAIVQDSNGEGSISNIDALNIQLENQVWNDLFFIILFLFFEVVL